jgi:methionyl-tRNA formyltransferase
MYGKNKTICIAGKNSCAINALAFVLKKKYKNYNILALPNKSDKGKDSWQKSFKKFAKKKKIRIVNLENLHNIEELYLFSLEYENIIDVKKFYSKNLFNFHFSLLPYYRGCHTNFYQIRDGVKNSGVTLHHINKGIDTGDIIDKIKYNININDTAYDNYKKLLRFSYTLFKKNLNKILLNKYNKRKQNIKKGSYFSRKSVDYKKIINIKKIDNKLRTHNMIRSLIFEPFQLPIYNGKFIKKSIFKNNKIKIEYKR